MTHATARHDNDEASAKTGQTTKKAGDGAASALMTDKMKKMQDQMTKLHAPKDPNDGSSKSHVGIGKLTLKEVHLKRLQTGGYRLVALGIALLGLPLMQINVNHILRD